MLSLPTEEVPITAHKIKLVQMLANGYNTREIAQALGNSYKTIETHFHQLKEKLGVRTAAELVACFFRAGLVK
jgi:two-component system nitrate/nitrite response regulator NarL